MKRNSDKKQIFVTPLVELIVIDSSDIITTSGQGGAFDGDPDELIEE